jgi:hypothetical protein
MPDLDSLRALATQVRPPDLEALEEVARRRARRTAVTTAMGGLVAVAAVVVGLVLATATEDRSAPEPVKFPSPTVTLTATEKPSPTEEATHRSDTSMTPKEVVQKPNANLMLTGVSADDPDFRLSIWWAPCTWCPNDDEARGRPRFTAMAITTDGFATATYLRPPWELTGLEHVESPGPGLLLILDVGNDGVAEWLVRDDGTITRLTTVVEQRRPGDVRLWHVCAGNHDVDYDNTWCALDPDANTDYVWEGVWRSTLTSSESVVSPGGTDEPWGLYWNRPDNHTPAPHELVAYWYADGVRLTKDFGPAQTYGETLNLPRGVMSVWALDETSHTMTVWSSSDRGATWRASRLEAPWTSRYGKDDGFHSRRLAVSRTPGGGLLALQEDAFHEKQPLYEPLGLRIWRAESADGGAFVNVFESRSPTDAPGEYSRRFVVVDGRIWSNGMWSDDDGRTWQTVPAWR